MAINIGLVGNPNCGKTTMFNNLTGSFQYVGNWPGVTVEKKSGTVKNKKDVNIVDLPGIYSLSPYTLEEVITRDYIMEEKPNVIINIIDASNLERNLYLTTQVIEMGIPTIIALNMMDIVKKNGETIDVSKLSKAIGCPIIETSALKGDGLNILIEKALEIVNKDTNKNLDIFSEKIEDVLSQIEDTIHIDKDKRWYSIKIFERDKKVLEKINLSEDEYNKIDNIIKQIETEFDDESESIIINERYKYITDLTSQIVSRKSNESNSISTKLDNILTNKYLGLPIFFGVMFLIYYISVTTIGTTVTDWTNDVFFGTYVNGFVEEVLGSLNVAEWLNSLIIDGIVGGVGAVLGFVPQMFILFLFLSLLEDCGYMSRIAFVMDKIFRKVGLSGKSFIPVLISTGCGVPGIMASRTIENERDRKITVMVTTFIPCGAKLPVIALFGAALFPKNPLIGPSVYFLGIAMILISGLILKKLKSFSGDTSPFIMELPKYHIPSVKTVLRHMWDRVKAFIIKAGTVIFAMSVIVWFLSRFNFSFTMVDVEDSILATIGKMVAPIFAPLGFNNWQATVATLNGLVAKEQLVSTYGVLLGLGEEITETDAGLIAQISSLFTTVSAYSFVAFNMLCAPCFAAIGAIKREMGNWKWTFIAIGYQTLLAYLVAFVIYQLGNLMLGAGFGIGPILAILVVIFTLYMMFRKSKH
ncbi:ferrous iron transport protein B [uncultured Tyzzerella sp.]|uniref:ferrous iron transport protein B n=1 Tax=uncultured Tyzzerella sp. TaxID=2321398 RepID=UPI00294357CD|nr:ferrous iron transport protein B [uncultured Tyzzerella sp.]